MHIGHDLLFNGVDIEKRLLTAVSDYNKKDYLSFGQQMGTMLSEIAIGTEIKMVGQNDHGLPPLPNIDVKKVE